MTNREPIGTDSDGTVVPVDLSGWFSGDPERMHRVAREVDQACAGSGFLAITGHGVSPSLMTRMLDTIQAFFDLPLETKLSSTLEDLTRNRGYTPPESEALSYSVGVESPPDLFEAFNIGREVPPPGETPEAIDTYFSQNVWPDEPAGMRATFLEYWDACEDLGFTLSDIFAKALELPDGWFRQHLDRSPSVMRTINYQRLAGSKPAAEGQLRMGAHSDYGNLTILLADRVAGLQISDDEGQFHDVLPPEGGFLVNLGDLLAEWTNDRWRSTVHRVVPPPAEVEGEFRRRSVAWFQQPNHDAHIEVLDSCCSPENPAKYPATTSGEHLMAKLMGPRESRPSEVDATFLA
ncbi:MAG: isopenicillin N synthase family dioxygenase [Acidimicrobiales bacterium]